MLARLCLMTCLAWGTVSALPAQDAEDEHKSTVFAPPKTRSMGDALGGAYFVDEALFQQHRNQQSKVEELQTKVDAGNVNPAVAEALDVAILELERLKAEMEQRKVLVRAYDVFTRKSEQVFELGDEQLVIITGDDVTVRGWKGPGIKCVLEKKILAKQAPDDAAFDAIHVHHELAHNQSMVGLTRRQRDLDEQRFLASEDGQKLNPEQLANRKKFVDRIHHSFDDYLAFQGKHANTLQLKGLDFREGNRNLTLRINSPDGGAMLSSEWQRHANLTVYVPPCKSLAVRGCQVKLDIQALQCDLVLTTHDSRDRDYEGSFIVRGVKGNVIISQVPVRKLSLVTGNVHFTATNEFVNSGTGHRNRTRSFAPYATHATEIEHVDGDVHATFLRTQLKLSAIKGSLDVTNRFGSTELTWSAVDSDRNHRVVSQSGMIRVQGPDGVLKKTPIYAYTECGRLHTNIDREILDDVSFSTGRPRRGWHGFITPSKDRFDISKFERPQAVLENTARKPGLDVLSHAGEVSIVTTGDE